MLVTCWLYASYMLAVCWLCAGCMLAVCWLYDGYMLVLLCSKIRDWFVDRSERKTLLQLKVVPRFFSHLCFVAIETGMHTYLEKFSISFSRGHVFAPYLVDSRL